MKRLSLFTKCLIIFVLLWLFLRFFIGGIVSVPLPSSVISMYLGLILLAILVHVSVEEEKFQEFLRPIKETLTEDSKKLRRTLLFILIPLVMLGFTFSKVSTQASPPASIRTAHPAPPTELTYREQVIGPTPEVENPFRHLKKDSPEEFQGHVENGRRVYYQNCFFCHGDNLDGEGHFAHGFNPVPANFQDPGIIPNFRETFLFWRISKGGPGLPAAGTPWDSAMPVWENFLTVDEIWDVILFLSEFTGYEPRTFGEAAH